MAERPRECMHDICGTDDKHHNFPYSGEFTYSCKRDCKLISRGREREKKVFRCRGDLHERFMDAQNNTRRARGREMLMKSGRGQNA